MSTPVTIMLLLTRLDCIDGVAAYIETLVTGLRDTGDRVILVTGPVTTTAEGSEVRRNTIAASVTEWVVFDDFRAVRPKPKYLQKIISLIRQYNVDVVSPQGFSMLPLATLAARLTGRPLVANYHPSVQGDRKSAMTGRLSLKEQIAYRVITTLCRADYIACSRHITLFFENDCRIPVSRIHEVVLGVDSDFYRAPTKEERQHARQQFGLDADMLVAVLPGRTNFNKGHDLAAAAFRMLRVRLPTLRTACLFPGGGGQREVIEADVMRDEADRATFQFLGYVDHETLRNTYWAADIVLLPSRVEGFGLVVAEAMCCGAIAIRTPSGGWQDQIIEGKTGYVVPFNDAPALAAAIETVAHNPDLPLMRHETIQFAARKFAKSRMVNGTSAVYRQIAAGLHKPVVSSVHN